ncbi:MAG: hypothetical protein AW07_02509 [Candidatus Accumulibacter sp. SK-11]|nr:MAG: hypothetical protein AW07_02509 [Candidatus Accumulibacter sp. SK-11]
MSYSTAPIRTSNNHAAQGRESARIDGSVACPVATSRRARYRSQTIAGRRSTAPAARAGSQRTLAAS